MKFLQNLKPKATLSKNVFDLSRKHVWSAKPGQLLPALCVETVPGDRFQIDLSSLQRTMSMNTAAFIRGKFHYDFFFVPYTQLWHNFNQFITQRQDRKSIMYRNFNVVPTFNLTPLLKDVWQDSGDVAGIVDVFGEKIAFGAQKLLDMLGYYGRLDMVTREEDLDAIGDKYVNVFRIAAYNKIWYDYYRNKYYDLDRATDRSQSPGGNVGPVNYPAGYNQYYIDVWNFDDVQCGSLATGAITKLRSSLMFTPRYVQWKKDLFTSLLPNTQFGAVSSVSLDLTIFNFSKWEETPTTRQTVQASTPNGVMPDGTVNTVNRLGWSNPNSVNDSLTFPNFSSFDILKLRQATALQKWKEATLRAGFDTASNFESHFGVTPDNERDHNVMYLGSFSSQLNVNPVESTASTGETLNGKVGQLAATGTAVTTGKPIKFKTNDYGIIMCMSYFRPEAEYEALMTDKANTLYEPYDFFTPEFENLGLEAVPHSELFGLYDSSTDNTPIGYAPRYYMYKTAVDKVFGKFKEGLSLSAWVAPRESTYFSSLGNFYVRPDILDNVFGVAADQTENTDNLLFNTFFDIKAIRPISVLGLPSL